MRKGTDGHKGCLQAQELCVHGNMIGCDFYDSIEIVSSSFPFMHSQTHSQPQQSCLQQFLFLNINYYIIVISSLNLNEKDFIIITIAEKCNRYIYMCLVVTGQRGIKKRAWIVIEFIFEIIIKYIYQFLELRKYCTLSGKKSSCKAAALALLQSIDIWDVIHRTLHAHLGKCRDADSQIEYGQTD